MLKDKIQDDLKKALKNRDALKISTLRFALSEIKNKEIEKRGDLADDVVMSLLAASVKRRRESIAQFKTGGREDLAGKEEAELDIIKTYLPEPMSQAELQSLVKDAINKLKAGPKDFGKVMKTVLAAASGRASGSQAQEIVKLELK